MLRDLSAETLTCGAISVRGVCVGGGLVEGGVRWCSLGVGLVWV